MAANTSPLFILTPNIAWASGIGTGTANTAMDGTGTVNTNIWLIFTAGAFGSFFSGVRVKALGTNVATVIRVFLNNGSTNGTAANNVLIGEIPLQATSASNNSSLPDIEWAYNKPIPAGYKIYVTIGTQIAAGVDAAGQGGDY